MAVVAFLRQSDLNGDAEQMERQSNGHAITSFRRMMANRLPRSLLQAVLLTHISAGNFQFTKWRGHCQTEFFYAYTVQMNSQQNSLI